jgi:ABC-2 type transport system ATP-binding protein
MAEFAPAAVRTDRLSKRFGATLAVDELSLTVAPPEVFGFLGPNGAGKSTTIRMLLGSPAPQRDGPGCSVSRRRG